MIGQACARMPKRLRSRPWHDGSVLKVTLRPWILSPQHDCATYGSHAGMTVQRAALQAAFLFAHFLP